MSEARNKAMRRAAVLLERQANELRRSTLVWSGDAYIWPRSARATKRLHDDSLTHAGELRRLSQ